MRSDAVAGPIYEFEGFQLDVERRTLKNAGGDFIIITGRAFDALAYLVEHAGTLVERKTLTQLLWPKTIADDNNLNALISTLRHLLNDTSHTTPIITTVSGRGYQLVARVHLVPAASDPADLSNAPSASTAVPSTRVWHKFGLVTLLLIGLMIVIIAVLNEPAPARGHYKKTAPLGPDDRASVTLSIAVLPFANLTGDGSKEYIGDGIADSLITQLSGIKSLRVPARTSSFAYKASNLDIQQVARRLGVEWVVEGSVRMSGERIRISSRVFHVDDGRLIWSESYDRQLSDILDIDVKLSSMIIIALGKQGVFSNMEGAEKIFTQAAEKDPNFSSAYSGLAMVYANRGMSNPKFLNKAGEAARKSLDIDSDNVLAQVVLARINFIQGNFTDAENLFLSLMVTNADDVFVCQEYAIFLMTTGRLRDAIKLAQHAHDVDPDNPSAIATLAEINAQLGKYDTSSRYVQRASELGASKSLYPIAGLHAFGKAPMKDREIALEWLLPRGERSATRFEDAIGLIYQALSNESFKAEAIAARKHLFPKSDKAQTYFQERSCHVIALLYVLLGETNTAYDLGYQCIDERVGNSVTGLAFTLLWAREMAPFRQATQFQDYATKSGLMDYWRAYGTPDDCNIKADKLVCI